MDFQKGFVRLRISRIKKWVFIHSYRFLLFFISAVPLSAHALNPEDEYRDKIGIREEISPLGENPFGEGWNAYTGTLSFNQTDIVLEGNGPPIVLERTHKEIGGNSKGETYYGFGDWGLNLPRISTLIPKYATTGKNRVTPRPPYGWIVSDASYARCTNFSSPSWAYYFTPDDWWEGYQLVMPDAGTQDLLKRSTANTLSPQNLSMNGVVINNFPAVTATHWMAGCGVYTENEASGREGFVVVSPSGMKYLLSWMIYRSSPGISVPGEVGGPSALGREMAHLLVRRIEDRFGNWLSYTYSGDLLNRIDASDGRQVTLTWRTDLAEPVITQISVQPTSSSPRVWSYSYSTNASGVFLSGITLPDGRAWAFNLASFADARPIYSGTALTCNATTATLKSPTNINTTYTGSITHPSGLVGSFSVRPVRHGRSYAPYWCNHYDTGAYSAPAYVYDTATLISKSFNNQGETKTWSHSYSSPNQSWSKDCSSGCVSTVDSSVSNPDGSQTKYTYSNKWDDSEGKLLTTSVYESGSSSPTRIQSMTYAAANSGAYPNPLGSLLTYRPNAAPAINLRPQSVRQIAETGDTYTWQALSFDSYGQALRVQSFNSISGQLTADQTTAYLNDTGRWILGQVQTVTDVSNGELIQQNIYDTNGLLQSRYAFGLKVMDYNWNAQGQLKTFTDGLMRSTTLDPYVLGVPQTIKFADNTTQKVAVNSFGEVTSTTDELGNTTSYTRDSMGRLVGVAYPTGDTVAWSGRSISYVTLAATEFGRPVGSWRSRSTEGRHQISTYYDAHFRPVLIEDKDSTTGSAIYTVQRYDDTGHVVFKSYPSTQFNETSGLNYSYDALGRLKQRRTTDGITLESIGYLGGNRRQVTDADGRVTTVTYQAFDTPSYERSLLHVSPQGQSTTINRNVYGEILSATQSGGGGAVTQTYVYDSYHRLCRHIEPETGHRVLSYDAAGQIAWVAEGQAGSANSCDQSAISSSAKILYSYDLRGRQALIDYPDLSGDISATYDAAGHLLTSNNPTAAWSYTYNKRGMMETERVVIDGKTMLLDSTYDAIGNVASLITPARTISYGPDAWGRPTQLGTYVNSIQYHQNGTVSSYGLANGETFSLTLDGRKRPYVQTTMAGSAYVQQYKYEYSSASDLTRIDDLVDNVDDATFAYDGLHRLTTATGLWGGYTYSYDALNNLKARSGPSALTYTYDTVTNRLTSLTGGVNRSYSYNSRGEVTGDGVRTYTRNLAGQITQVSNVGTYAYDGNGKRIKRVTSAGSEYTLYDAGGKLVYSELGSAKTDYLALHGHVVTKLVLNAGITTPQYLHDDLLGSPRKATNATPTISWQETYEPYGKKMNGTAEKIGYTGHAYDSESSLTYMQARLYDAEVGRFLSPDPVNFQDGEPFSFNRYAYANNSPYRFTDPTGLKPCEDPCGAGERLDNLFRKLTEAFIPGVAYNNLGSAAEAQGHYLSAIGWYTAGQLEALGTVATAGLSGVLAGVTRSATVAARGTAQVTLNRAAGNAFRDELASRLSLAGREVSTEVYKKTPFGARFIDIEVSHNGTVLGGIETKVGTSRYRPSQQLKDWWLTNVEGYPVNVARKP